MERLDLGLEFGLNWLKHCMDFALTSCWGMDMEQKTFLIKSVLQNPSAAEFDGQNCIWALRTAQCMFKSRIILYF